MPPKSDFLERHGGWILIGLGAALIALAALLADNTVVASIFAFTGVASAVFGVVLARLEGPFELTPTGFKATLNAAREVIEREDFTVEQKGDELIGLFEEASAPSQKNTGRMRSGSYGADRLSTESPHDRAQRFEGAVRRQLEAEGWSVSDIKPEEIPIGDFQAVRSGRRFIVETKPLRRLGAADIRSFIDIARALDGIDQFESVTFVLAVPRDALTAGARDALQRAADDIRLMELDVPMS